MSDGRIENGSSVIPEKTGEKMQSGNVQEVNGSDINGSGVNESDVKEVSNGVGVGNSDSIVLTDTNGSIKHEPTHGYSTRRKELIKEEKLKNQSELKRKQANVILHPRLKPFPYKILDLTSEPTTAPVKFPSLVIGEKQFYQSEDHPFNRRGFKYKPCKPNTIFASNKYSTTELPPFKVRPCYFDRAHDILFDESMESVTTPQGWRSVRTNIGVRGDKFYFEFNIVNANEPGGKGHARIGIARKEASLEAPVGFDGYSYGFRDVHGELMTLSRPKVSFIENGFKSGDTIGFLLDLPSIEKHRIEVDKFTKSRGDKTNLREDSSKKRRKTKKSEHIEDNEPFIKDGNIVRDQIPIKYKGALYYEQFEYTNTKVMDHLLNPVTLFGEKAYLENENQINSMASNLPIIPNGKVRIFKNGIEQKSIETLYSFLPTNIENDKISFNTKQQQNPNYRNTDDGTLGYYPMISVFGGGIVSLNAGPEFKYPVVETGVKPLSDRYNEHIVEEWYWDIVDEIEAEYFDNFEE